MAKLVFKEYKHYDVDEIKNKIDLRKVIMLEKERDFGEYKSGLCPFHPDSRPSFLVYPKYYTCLSSGCGVWGSIIDWLAFQHPGKEFLELLELAAEETVYLAPTPAGYKPPKPPEFEILPDPLAPGSGLGYYKALGKIAKSRFMKKYGLSEGIMEREMIGYDAECSAYVIPVWGCSYYELLTFRFRRDDYVTRRGPKYWGVKGRNNVMLYNRRVLQGSKEVLLFFGELKALLATDLGFAGVSQTNGCRAFQKYLLSLFDEAERVTVIPDVDEEEDAVRTARLFGDRGHLLVLPGLGPKEDFTDWVVKHGHTASELASLLADAVMPGEVKRHWEGVGSNRFWRR